MDESSDELFKAVQARDPEAWARFVERFGGLVAAVPRRARLNSADVDDVVQATWLQLLRHAPLIRRPRSIPAWILTTANRETWRVQSKGRDGHRELLDDSRVESVGEDVAAEFEKLESAQLLHDAVKGLGGPCDTLLEALFLRDVVPSYADLAAELGVPIGTLGPTRQRCLGRLAAELDREGFRVAERGTHE